MKKISKYDKLLKYECKGGIIMAKRDRDIRKILTKVMASFLAILMVGGVAATLIYYITAA